MNENNIPNENVPAPSQSLRSALLSSQRMLLMREAVQTHDLRDYLSMFFKHKRGILIAFLAIFILGCASALIYKQWIYRPVYEAKSSLLVKIGWENYSPDFSLENRQIPSVNQTDILGSEVRILESRELKEKLISSLGLETLSADLSIENDEGISKTEVVMKYFDKNLVVNPGKKGGSVIDVTYNGYNPALSAAVVNQLVKFYIDRRSEIYKDPKSVLFLEKKAEEYRQKLAESEERLKAFRKDTKIISFEEQRSMLLKRHSELMAYFDNTANQIKEVQERIGESEKQLSSLPKTIMTQGAYDTTRDAQARLLNLQLQEKELLSKYKEDNPLVSNIRSQAAIVKEYLEKSSTNNRQSNIPPPPDPVYQEVQKQILSNRAELSALKVRYADTEKQINALSAEIQGLEALDNHNKELARDVSSNEEKYHGYRQRLEEAKVYDELDRQKMTSVSVIELAAVPVFPMNPRPLFVLLLIALGVAIVGSLGIAYVSEHKKQVMSKAAEAEKKLDLPVLITIPIKN